MNLPDDTPETSTYDVVDVPRPPKLPGAVVLRPSEDEALDTAAAEAFMHALTCVRTFGDFHMAVSAAPSNEPLFRRLMLDPGLREFPWAKTHLWLIDELQVHVDDPRRRGITALDLLAEPSDIPRSQVHLIDLEDADPATHYEQQLGEHLGWREKGHDRLDYALLDMSDGVIEGDLHHAYVPGSPALTMDGPRDPLVTRVPVMEPPRIALTLRAISAARLIAGVITGGERQSVVQGLVAGTHAYSRLRPLGGEFRWYVDHAAARQTDRKQA